MHTLSRWTLVGCASILAATPGFAQVITFEVEPNDSKAAATAVASMTAGNTIVGNSISATTTGLDYYDITMAAAPLGIYRHELTLTTTGTAGHTGTLRGLNQTGGVAGTCPALGTAPVLGSTDNTAQTSSTASTPPRMNAWYGFGKGERIYYRVTGTASTTLDYTAQLSTTPVIPTVIPGSFSPGTISISTVGQTSADTDLLVLDSNLNPVLDASLGYSSNDDEHCTTAGVTSTALQSRLVRNLPGGTYYLGIGGYDTKDNNLTPIDDDFMLGTVMDFPNAVVSSSTLTSSDRDFVISDGTNTYTATGQLTSQYFEVKWYQFTVGSANITAFCDPGSGGIIACPCANPPSAAGKGCDNSAATGGASIFGTGSANTASDSLVFNTSAQTANGTTIVLQGNSLAGGGSGVPFGQGVRCVGGTLKRLYLKSPGGTGGISAPVGADPSVSAQSANLGDPIAPASTRYYMAYYRDPIVLGGCATSATFNATNALQVVWQ